MRALLAAGLLLTTPALASAATITGSVSWARATSTTTIAPTRDRHVCAGPYSSPDVTVSAGGGVAEVVVFIDGAPVGRPGPPETVRIDQLGCRFSPHVAAARVGARLVFANSDPLLHNVHVYDAAGRTLANWAMPVQGQEVTLALKSPGDLSIRCDAGHDWMRAHVRVFSHGAFTRTAVGGGYRLGGLAPGLHRVVAWHPDLGRAERLVQVEEGRPARVDLTLEGGAR